MDRITSTTMVGAIDVQDEASVFAALDASQPQVPSVRDAVRKISGFAQLIRAQEALARNGAGGLVRIGAMAPVMDAIDQYVAQLPAMKIEL
jgi:hypothetical protein